MTADVIRECQEHSRRFVIEAFERIDGMKFRSMVFWEAHEVEDIAFCLVH